MRQVKASGEGAFALAPTVRVTISTLPNLLSPINLHCHRIKNGGYNNIKSANKCAFLVCLITIYCIFLDLMIFRGEPSR